MKTALSLLSLIILLFSWSCASKPTGPSEPGRPWISELRCPPSSPIGEMVKLVFVYQGDQYPAYAEISGYRLSGMGPESFSGVGPVVYRFENQYEVPFKITNNPSTWGLTLYVVDRKGRHSNELSCQVSVR